MRLTSEDTVSSLFVVHNGRPEFIEAEKIFDASVYDTLYGVSYVSSPKFFFERIKDFNDVKFIVGIPDSEYMEDFQNSVVTLIADAEKGVNFFNELPPLIKNKVADNALQIRCAKPGLMFHDKLYLLANEKENRYRVVIGSANFNPAAFDPANANFENVRIDDGKALYDIYLARFNELYSLTNDYIPEKCKRRYKETKTLVVVDAEERADLIFDALDDNRTNIVVSGEYREEINRAVTKMKLRTETIEKSAEVLKSVLSSKRADGTFGIKLKETLLKNKQGIKNFFVRSQQEAVQNDIREILLPSEDDYLYKQSHESKDEVSMYSQLAPLDKIRASLEKINAFTEAYYKYAASPNWVIPAKIYETILYTFTSPFIWRIRQQYAVEYDKASVCDIPMFCVIGGIRESGKSTLLSILAQLMGQTSNHIYDFAKYLEKAGHLSPLLESSNLMPIFTDEITPSFFQKSNGDKGENLVKRFGNEVPVNSRCTMIGTTNCADFSSAGQVMRRIYYLEVNNMFDARQKSESMSFLRNVREEMTDVLFKDFSYRFGNALRNNEKIFQIEDFLSLARKIFRDYYKECDMEMPHYFPEAPFYDYDERKRHAWRQLYIYNRAYFHDMGETIRLDIASLLKFATGSNTDKKREQWRNYLDETCWAADTSVGVYWFLKKKEFFNFIEHEPTLFEKTTDRIKLLWN